MPAASRAKGLYGLQGPYVCVIRLLALANTAATCTSHRRRYCRRYWVCLLRGASRASHTSVASGVLVKGMLVGSTTVLPAIPRSSPQNFTKTQCWPLPHPRHAALHARGYRPCRGCAEHRHHEVETGLDLTALAPVLTTREGLAASAGACPCEPAEARSTTPGHTCAEGWSAPARRRLRLATSRWSRCRRRWEAGGGGAP